MGEEVHTFYRHYPYSRMAFCIKLLGGLNMLLKKRKPGRKINEISLGEKLTLTEKIEDKELLLYLGLTNDANPLYIQHDYASQTPFEKPLVPAIMLTGIITSAVSKYIPGPGSYILSQEMSYVSPVYHEETITFFFEVTSINLEQNQIEISVTAKNEQENSVLTGKLMIVPPFFAKKNTSKTIATS